MNVVRREPFRITNSLYQQRVVYYVYWLQLGASYGSSIVKKAFRILSAIIRHYLTDVA